MVDKDNSTSALTWNTRKKLQTQREQLVSIANCFLNIDEELKKEKHVETFIGHDIYRYQWGEGGVCIRN